MKKIILAISLVSIYCTSQAFNGTIRFSESSASVEHTLKISNWRVNNKGIPSFDYVYHQNGNKCNLELSGRAVAGSEEKKGKTVFEMYDEYDSNGKVIGRSILFDNGFDVFTLLNDELKKPKYVNFGTVLSPKALLNACSRDSDRLGVIFKNLQK